MAVKLTEDGKVPSAVALENSLKQRLGTCDGVITLTPAEQELLRQAGREIAEVTDQVLENSPQAQFFRLSLLDALAIREADEAYVEKGR